MEELVFKPARKKGLSWAGLVVFVVGLVFLSVGGWILANAEIVAASAGGLLAAGGIYSAYLLGALFGVAGAIALLSAVLQGKIVFHLTDEGLLVTGPLAKRLFAYRDVLEIQKIDAEGAEKIIADAEMAIEKLKAGGPGIGYAIDFVAKQREFGLLLGYLGRQVAMSSNARETSWSIGPFGGRKYTPPDRVDVYGLSGEYVLLTVAREGAEPARFLMDPENPDGFVSEIKRRMKAQSRIDSGSAWIHAGIIERN